MSYRINRKCDELVVGMKVTTDYIPGEEQIIRTLTMIRPDTKCGSGLRAIADEGDGGTLVDGYGVFGGIDASWMIPFEER